MVRSVVAGAVAAIVFCFPCAAVLALFYRFPVPFGGYAIGVDGALPAMLAVAFYGIALGGFVLVGVLGGSLAMFASSSAQASRRIMVQSLGIAFTATLSLATLELFIGPW
jgi:hypothetical protein